MVHVLLHLLPVLWLLNAVHTSSECTMKRTSSLRFSAYSTVNEQGQRTISVEGLGEAREKDTVGVSVEHWTAICHDLQFVGLQLNVTSPTGSIDKPAVTDKAVPELTTDPSNVTTEEAVHTVTAASSIATEQQNITTERPIATPISGQSCRSGYESLSGDVCYKFIGEYMTREAAQLNCERDGGNLAVPKTEQEMELIIEMAQRAGHSPFLGIHKSGGQWTTVDGSSSYIRWYPGQPDGSGDCVFIAGDGLADYPCQDKLASICEQRRP